MNKKYPLAIAALAAVASLPVVGATPATAEDPPTEQTCIIDLDALTEVCNEKGKIPAPDANPYGGGLAPGQTQLNTISGLAQVDQVAAIERATGKVVITIFWSKVNHQGTDYVYVTSHGCDKNADIDWQISNVGVDRNDKFSSGTGFSNCEFRVFENANFVPNASGWMGEAPTFGALNRQTTSVKWR